MVITLFSIRRVIFNAGFFKKLCAPGCRLIRAKELECILTVIYGRIAGSDMRKSFIPHEP